MIFLPNPLILHINFIHLTNISDTFYVAGIIRDTEETMMSQSK